MEDLRKELINQIHGLNTTLSDEYLNSISTQALINNSHPTYRHEYQARYDKMIINHED